MEKLKKILTAAGALALAAILSACMVDEHSGAAYFYNAPPTQTTTPPAITYEETAEEAPEEIAIEIAELPEGAPEFLEMFRVLEGILHGGWGCPDRAMEQVDDLIGNTRMRHYEDNLFLWVESFGIYPDDLRYNYEFMFSALVEILEYYGLPLSAEMISVVAISERIAEIRRNARDLADVINNFNSQQDSDDLWLETTEAVGRQFDETGTISAGDPVVSRWPTQISFGSRERALDMLQFIEYSGNAWWVNNFAVSQMILYQWGGMANMIAAYEPEAMKMFLAMLEEILQSGERDFDHAVYLVEEQIEEYLFLQFQDEFDQWESRFGITHHEEDYIVLELLRFYGLTLSYEAFREILANQ
ncbi:MAG: hypothetical protein FWB96_00470 [Defluviitaleaceae bacterium]|nr:hypothetical protein [Defluviitaleaceae bacterium]MCL2261813.1 hypothetical protein [Defluviitaleaceae bacterium]